MFNAAARPVAFAARAALRKPAARALLSTTAVRRSDLPAPPLFGPGAKAGEVPTDVDQSTGLERLQVLGAIEGVDVFDKNPLPSERYGTLTDPVKVFSMDTVRTIGCTGVPAESHDLIWMNLSTKKNRRCPECGSVYALDYQGDEEIHLHTH